jgi:small subunit ribosomal protein S19
MSRSKWKGLFVDKKIFNKQLAFKNKKIWSRNSVIPAFLVGNRVLIHNGLQLKKVQITREKVGYKFGEFALTRTSPNKYKPRSKKLLIKKKKS